jgi:hypothetical protein
MTSANTIEKIKELLPTLAADDEVSILEHIVYLRGPLILSQLSPEDEAELLRRAADTSELIPLEQVFAEAKAKIACYRP